MSGLKLKEKPNIRTSYEIEQDNCGFAKSRHEIQANQNHLS